MVEKIKEEVEDPVEAGNPIIKDLLEEMFKKIK